MNLSTFGKRLCVALSLPVMLLTPCHAGAQTYPIGVIFPLSGPNTVYGQTFSKGAELAAKNINAAHELPNQIKLLFEDSQALPQPAIIAMNKLVNIEQAPFVLSAFSGVTKAVAPIATRRKVVVVNGGAVSPELAGLSPYLFNVIPLANDEIAALLPYITSKLNLRRIMLTYVNDPFGQSVLNALTQQCLRLGCRVEDISVSPGATNFQAEVAKIRAMRPDAVYVASYGQQQNVILKQLRDGGVTAQFLSYSGINLPDTMKLPAAQGLIFTTEYVGLDSPDPVTQKFVESFRAAYGTATPSFYSVNYYNAILLFAQSAKWLVEKKHPVTGENLLGALHSIRTFNAVGGTITFEPNGTVRQAMQILRVVNGRPQVIATVQ
jgi:ABC-type branched-subunit amino acid transport system substrate-binding protein